MNPAIPHLSSPESQPASSFTMNTCIPLFERLGALARHLPLTCLLLLSVGTADPSYGAGADSLPDKMTFQSHLTQDNNAALADDNYAMTFSIHNKKEGGDQLWTENQNVSVSGGYFSVLLGEVNSLVNTTDGSAHVFTSGERWVQINVAGTVLKPRLQLLPAPFAFMAKRASEADRLRDADGEFISRNGSTTTIGSAAQIDGATSVAGDLTTTQKITAKSAQLGDVPGDAITINGTMTANAPATFNNHTTLGNGVGPDVVTIDSSINQISGVATLRTTTVDGNLEQSSGSATLKATSFEGDIQQTSGATTLKKTTVEDDLIVADDLKVGAVGNGVFTMDGSLVVQSTGSVEIEDVDYPFNGGDVSSPSVRIYGGSLDTALHRLHLRFYDYGGNTWDFRTKNSGTDSLERLHLYYGSTLKAYLQKDQAGWQTPSDRRLKKNFERISDGVLDRLEKISAYRFHYNDADESAPKNIGVIAQEVRDVFPEAVSGEESAESYLGLNYGNLAPLAIAGINELRRETGEQVDSLTQRNESLEKENAALKKQFGELLSRLQKLENQIR